MSLCRICGVFRPLWGLDHLLLSPYQTFPPMWNLRVSLNVVKQFLPLNCSERHWKLCRAPPVKWFCISSAALEHFWLSQVDILYVHFLSLVFPATLKHTELCWCPPACSRAEVTQYHPALLLSPASPRLSSELDLCCFDRQYRKGSKGKWQPCVYSSHLTENKI